MTEKITMEDINSLYPYQKETLRRQVIDYLIQNADNLIHEILSFMKAVLCFFAWFFAE